MKKIISLFAIIALILSGCNNVTKKSSDLDKVSLRFDWTTNMSFFGDIVGMNDYAKKNRIELTCLQAGEGVDPIKMIISGTDQIGITTFDKLLAANEKGADLVAIGFINNASPTVFLTRKSEKFSDPKDFEGKSVGIMPGGSTEFVYRGFLKKTGVDEKKVKEIPAGFDLTGFINKIYDIKLAFIYVEPVALDEQGFKYNMIEPRNFGVVFPGRVYFAKKEFVENHKDLVQRFINTVLEGWEASYNNPDDAAKQLKAYDINVDEARERKSFDKGVPYFNGYNKQLLMVDESKLKEQVALLKYVGLIQTTDYIKSVDLSFVKNYYAK
jgi:ABC-type nitrate/sulfonate/bicarbonate transport system substrate-binding protein